MKIIKIGTRKSKLAMWQAEHVADLLEQAGIKSEIISTETIGDKILNTSIAKIGSKGVFTEEIEDMLKNGEVDIAVHSAKDLPSELPGDFQLLAFGKREKVNDVLLSNNPDFSVDSTGKVVTIGTSSVRRVAMLRHYYPHVKTVEMRGNLQTRIKKMEDGHCDALMLAYAGVTRMNYDDRIVKILSEKEFITPTGQGSVAVEVSVAMPEDIKSVIKNCINCAETEARIIAERSFLKELQGGCSIPVFAYASLVNNKLSLSGGLISLDGQTIIKNTIEMDVSKALELGTELGRYVLESGGRELLAEIRQQQAG
jgi:hydroxymethylbilane synthase